VWWCGGERGWSANRRADARKGRGRMSWGEGIPVVLALVRRCAQRNLGHGVASVVAEDNSVALPALPALPATQSPSDRVTEWRSRASPRGATSAAVEPCMSRAQCPSAHILVDVSELIKATRTVKRRAGAAESQTPMDLTKCHQNAHVSERLAVAHASLCVHGLQRGWMVDGCGRIRRCKWHAEKKTARLLSPAQAQTERQGHVLARKSKSIAAAARKS